MQRPNEDAELVQIVDAAWTDAAGRAGSRLVCRPGCTQCCHGAFAISSLDAARLNEGMNHLRANQPGLAGEIEFRAFDWVAAYSDSFPGDLSTGVLGTSEEEQERFEEFANEAACPALDPATGLCGIYAWRPMTCRIFGPPVRSQEGLGHCELCFVGATPEEVSACEMALPHDREAALCTEPGETVVALALLR